MTIEREDRSRVKPATSGKRKKIPLSKRASFEWNQPRETTRGIIRDRQADRDELVAGRVWEKKKEQPIVVRRRALQQYHTASQPMERKIDNSNALDASEDS